MGRPPSNGGPSFRFNHTEVAEMEAILQAHNAQMPTREVLDALAEKFSTSAERSGKVVVQMKQIWNWFQNRRYAIRAKAGKPPVKLTVSTPQNNSTTMKNVPLTPQLAPSSTAPMSSVLQNTKTTAAPPAQDAVRNVSESQMEFEARSASDGAWYDVASFLSHRSVETDDPEVLVRFSGFGPEEDEWVNVRKHIRQRSLPCESSECIVVLPGDLILCFQEGKEQALYYDAHILDSQRRRHDIRGCRCRFLVRYDHDQSEEIVPLRKICRRPETDHRLLQLDAESGKVNQQRTGADALSDNTTKCCPVIKTVQNDQNLDQTADRRANCPVSLDVSQVITGSHSHSGHIPKVNQNSELTPPPPIAKTGLDSISTPVLPATDSHATTEEKVKEISELTDPPKGSDAVLTHMLASSDSHVADVANVNQTSELTKPLPTAKTGSDSISTQVLPATENHATTEEKVKEISELTHPSKGSDAVLTHMLASSDSHVADVANVNQTSELTQPPPTEKTDSDSIATHVLPTMESHATKVDQISELTDPLVAETGSDTVLTHTPPSDSHAADVVKVNQTSEMTQLLPLAESETDTLATQVVPLPENHAAAAGSVPSQSEVLPAVS